MNGIDKPMIGLSKEIEKSYFRLTAEPNPYEIRPQNILELSLKNISISWKNRDYSYALDQLRAIRQDLTVQQIENDFTIKVYETNIRIALEGNAFDQYNQCHTCLMTQYAKNPECSSNKNEFDSYNMLYLHLNNRQDELSQFLKTVDLKAPIIDSALSLVISSLSSNYRRFFILEKSIKKWGRFITCSLIPIVRERALRIISNVYQNTPHEITDQILN
eukprot:GHVP01053260.1.p2 GENE.GHVP01053260.1~~GHVP01053260.1.p2  ORF type:complete len:218 (-),score=29.89 GHVP01053260.1:1603-2256(-)